MRTCRKCGLSKNIDQFEVSRVVNGREYIRSSCRECVAESVRARRKEVAKPKVFKREPKIIAPEFVRTSIISKGDKHTIKATIRKGIHSYEYIKAFDTRSQAQYFESKINTDPKSAAEYLSESRLIKNNGKSIYGRGEV